ncbi:RNA-metabolising metallo-beta-lactamase family protein [Asticcacaulis biprosthecium C19]|uniref:RNA-metabolising metallo-beta-lactamase family protein n=2 Tax=Asticcacaulis biprosthecium TaxID=76891 RepID=F4QQW1_9CAUL|nr:RNA-metabolising metallo-beta-lactamase family protein [Asticcacaulis biprosthecium C19]
MFLPLGGSNEIGMNLNLYGFGPADDRQWIIVDVGVTFGDLTTPGIEVIAPDPEFLVGENLLGIVLTHAHEDHIGALGWLWDKIKAPVFATPFTAFLIREKLREAGVDDADITEVPLNGNVKLGPFDIDYITITHSIPEPNGLAIKTPLGTILHTGDWKIDEEPITGQPTDIAELKRLGDQGVLAMVCDSTNVFVEGRAGSEAGVREELEKLIRTFKKRVAVACFASNVARMDSVMRAAMACKRQVCLVGRSMHRMLAASRHVGLLQGIPDPISEGEAANFKPHQVLYLCTGSQGEPRAALSRIADGNHPQVKLKEGDVCVFSSRVIPGNEIAIRSLQNRLSDLGVEIHTERDHPGIHVSGHPCREELKDMYQWVRPAISVPTHGERRHLLKHAALAAELGVPRQVTPRNGDMVRLAPGLPEIIDEVPSGRLFVDGGMLVPEASEALRERRHAAHNGMIFVAFALNSKNQLASIVDVRGLGLAFENEDTISDQLESLCATVEKALKAMPNEARDDDETVETVVARVVKKAAQAIWDRRPIVETIILRT